MQPITPRDVSSTAGVETSRQGLPTRPSAEELALLDELDRLARLRSSTPPLDGEYIIPVSARPRDRKESLLPGPFQQRPASRAEPRESLSESGMDWGTFTEKLPTTNTPMSHTDASWTRYPRLARPKSRHLTPGHLPTTRSSSTLAELGRLAAIDATKSSSSSPTASMSASPRTTQRRVKRYHQPVVKDLVSAPSANDERSHNLSAGGEAIIGRVATTETADWTDDFCFPENTRTEAARKPLAQVGRHAPTASLFRVPSAPVFSACRQPMDASSPRWQPEADESSTDSHLLPELGKQQPFIRSDYSCLTGPPNCTSSPTAAHQIETEQPSQNLSLLTRRAHAENRSPANVRTRHVIDRSEMLVAASLSPRSRMLMRTAHLTETLQSDRRLNQHAAIARNISAVLDTTGDGQEDAPSTRTSGMAFEASGARVCPQASRATARKLPCAAAPCSKSSETPSTSATSKHSADADSVSESDSDSDWDARLESQADGSATAKTHTVSGFVPSAYAFDGGCCVSFEDGAIPAFFRIVDRARTLYRGRVIVRYPRPSSLVYSRIPETRAIQFGEKELELWLVGLITTSRRSPFEHPCLPPEVVKWIENSTAPGQLFPTEDAVHSVYTAAADENAPWASFVMHSIGHICACSGQCREQQTLSALQTVYLGLEQFDALLAQSRWPATLEPWLGTFFFPAWGALLPRVCSLRGVPKTEPLRLLSLLDGISARLHSEAAPALYWQSRLLVAELVIHFGPERFCLTAAAFWERAYEQPQQCLLQFASIFPKTFADESSMPEPEHGLHQDHFIASAIPVLEGFGMSHVAARAACTIYWLLCGISPFSLEPLDYDLNELDGVLALCSEERVPRALRSYLNTPAALCNFLARACMPRLPLHCESRCRCSALLGYHASRCEQRNLAESHYFEALFVLHGCPVLADSSPCASEFAQSLLERYAEVLRQGAKYRYAVAALTAAADAFQQRLGHESNLFLQRISELALSEQDYVRAIQANIALLRAVCLEGQLLQAIHVTLRLGQILVEAGWFTRAEHLLSAVWQAIADTAPSLTDASLDATTLSALSDERDSFASAAYEQSPVSQPTMLIHSLTATSSRALEEPSDRPSHLASDALVCIRPERRTIESHLSDLLMLLSDVRIRAGHTESALQPLFQLERLLPKGRRAIVHRKLADIWLRLGNTTACRQSYLRYLARSWSGLVSASTTQPPGSKPNAMEAAARSRNEKRRNSLKDTAALALPAVSRRCPADTPSAPGHPDAPPEASPRNPMTTADAVDTCPSSSCEGLVRGRAPPEATILALLYEERYLDALDEIDCAAEMTNSRRLRNLARLMHIRGQVLREMASRLENTLVVRNALLSQASAELGQQFCLSRIRLMPPMKLLRQLPDCMQRSWKLWLARSTHRPDIAPPTIRDVIQAARRSFDAAAYLYSVMADEIYAAMSAVAALRTDIEWTFRQLVKVEHPTEQTSPNLSEWSERSLTVPNLDWESCEERLLEAASIFMETNLVQASMEVSVTMAQLMILRRHASASAAFLREAWATFSSLYVNARTSSFAFSRMASPILLKELRQLLSRMVLVLYCLPNEVVLEMQLLLDVHNQLALDTVLTISRKASRGQDLLMPSNAATGMAARNREQRQPAEQRMPSSSFTLSRLQQPKQGTAEPLVLHGRSALPKTSQEPLDPFNRLRMNQGTDAVSGPTQPGPTAVPVNAQPKAHRPAGASQWSTFWGKMLGSMGRRLKPLAPLRREYWRQRPSKRRQVSHAVSRVPASEVQANQTSQATTAALSQTSECRQTPVPEPTGRPGPVHDPKTFGGFPTVTPPVRQFRQRSRPKRPGDHVPSVAAPATAGDRSQRSIQAPQLMETDGPGKTRLASSLTATPLLPLQPVASPAELGPLFEQACARIVRDVLDDTRRSETAQLCALLQQLDWYEANSPNVLNALFGSDDPVHIAWSMQQRFEMQTERYRRGEVSTSELARYNEESLEIWLHEMGKLSQRIPMASPNGMEATRMSPEGSSKSSPVPSTTNLTAAAVAPSGATAASGAPASSTISPAQSLQTVASNVLYLCNIGGLVCVYNLMHGFRYLFTWEPCQAMVPGMDTRQDGFCLVPHGFATDDASLPSPSRVTATGELPLMHLQQLASQAALFLPVTVDQTPWLLSGPAVQQVAHQGCEAARPWGSRDVAQLLGIRPEQWLHHRSRTRPCATEQVLGLLLCDPTLYLVPWEMLLEAPLVRACSLQDCLEQHRCFERDVSEISQLVVFHSEQQVSMPGAHPNPMVSGTLGPAFAASRPSPNVASWRSSGTLISERRSSVLPPGYQAMEAANSNYFTVSSFCNDLAVPLPRSDPAESQTLIDPPATMQAPPSRHVSELPATSVAQRPNGMERALDVGGISAGVTLQRAAPVAPRNQLYPSRGTVAVPMEQSEWSSTASADRLLIRPVVQVLPVSLLETAESSNRNGTEHPRRQRECLHPALPAGLRSEASTAPDNSRPRRPFTEGGERLLSSAWALFARRASTGSNSRGQTRLSSSVPRDAGRSHAGTGKHPVTHLESSTGFGYATNQHNSASHAGRSAVTPLTAICLFPYEDLAYPGRMLLEMRAVCPNAMIVFIPSRQLDWFKTELMEVLRSRDSAGHVLSVQALVCTLMLRCLEQQVLVAFMHGALER